MHELPGAQHLEELGAQVSGDGLHQTQCSLDRVLGVPDLFQVGENGHQGLADLIQLGGREQVVQREVLHQRVVVIDCFHSLFQTWEKQRESYFNCITGTGSKRGTSPVDFNGFPLTGVGVEADGRMETFSVFEDVQGEQNLRALSLLLDPVQGSLQIEPETDLLQGRARSWVTVEFSHLFKRQVEEMNKPSVFFSKFYIHLNFKGCLLLFGSL